MGYSQQVYEETTALMNQKRLYSEQELEKRRKLLYSKHPRAKEIESELVSISVAAGKAVISGADIKDQLLQLRTKSLDLQSQLKAILESESLPENYLEPWFECEICQDTGYVDGRMCSCMKDLLRRTAYKHMNLSSKLPLTDFDSFSLSYYPDTVIQPINKNPREYMTNVLRYCRNYADNFSTESGSLLMQGGPGLGKTHLSLSIAKTVIDRGFGVIYVSAPSMLKQLEDEHFGRGTDTRGVSEQLMTECDLLIIDDLGTEFLTKFSISTIYNIINTRILAELPTIISTNFSIKELQENYGIRMISRIIGTLDRIEFFGSDIRQIKRKERNNKRMGEINNG